MPGFSSDPIIRANPVVASVRSWYEDHRESLSERWFRDESATDQFIHDLVHKVLIVNAEANPPPVNPAAPPTGCTRPIIGAGYRLSSRWLTVIQCNRLTCGDIWRHHPAGCAHHRPGARKDRMLT